MGYRDYDRGYNNRGYNNRGYDNRGYNDRGYDRRDYNDRGYDNRRDYNDRPDFPFAIGEKVIHKATGTELYVINYGREQLECRKPDLGTAWFYVHELTPCEQPAEMPNP